MLIIAVHDKVAGTWSPPSVAQNRETAIRDFRTACNKSGSLLFEHPDDFELWIIGEWHVPYDTNRMPTFTVFDKFQFVEAGVPHERKD